jgi:hypothetical protein
MPSARSRGCRRSCAGALAAGVPPHLPYEPARWLLLCQRLADAPPARLPVPVLERYARDGEVERTLDDFGPAVPLPAQDYRAV